MFSQNQQREAGLMEPVLNEATRQAIDYMLICGRWTESFLAECVYPQLVLTPDLAESIIAVANERQNPKPEIDYSEEAKARGLAELKLLEQVLADHDLYMSQLADEHEQAVQKSRNETAELKRKIAEINHTIAAESNKRILQLTRVLKHCYATARPVQSTARQSHCRASASRTRVTGSNGKKATSGSGGCDPDPEPRRQPRLSGLLALRNILTASRTLIAANTYRPEVLA